MGKGYAINLHGSPPQLSLLVLYESGYIYCIPHIRLSHPTGAQGEPVPANYSNTTGPILDEGYRGPVGLNLYLLVDSHS
jgi:hypothetical protein